MGNNSTGIADIESMHRPVSSYGGTYLLTSSPVKKNFELQSLEDIPETSRYRTSVENWDDESRDIPAALPQMIPNRKKIDIEMAELERIESLTETNLSVHNLRGSSVNPMISNFTSPIGR